MTETEALCAFRHVITGKTQGFIPGSGTALSLQRLLVDPYSLRYDHQ